MNAVEPGTVVPIHRHPTKDESFVILRGKVRVTTHNDDGSIIEDVVLSQESGNYGVDIPKIVVSTSAYAGMEIPVDTIIGYIGTTAGFKLKGIEKLRDIRKRKTKNSGNIDFLRESLIKLMKA